MNVSNFFENSRRYSQVKVHHRSTTPVANLPPVANFNTNLAPVVDTGVIDIGGKFAAGINDTFMIGDFWLRISPRIFENFRNGPIGILRGLGETDT
jgi:hypothetical protein